MTTPTRVNDRGQLEVQYPSLPTAWVPGIVLLPAQDGYNFKLSGLQASHLQLTSQFLADIDERLSGEMTELINSLNLGLSDPAVGVKAKLIEIEAGLAAINASVQGTTAAIDELIGIQEVDDTYFPLLPRIQNFAIANANTEYQILFPATTQKFAVKCRGGPGDKTANLKVAWKQGVVAGTPQAGLVDGYDAIPVNSQYFEESVYLAEATPLYISADSTNVPIAIHTWKSSLPVV